MKKYFIIVFILFIISSLFSQSANITKENPRITGKNSNSAFKDINDKYGVEVITDVNLMIPDNWISSPVNGKAKALSSKYYEKVAGMIASALKEYPRDFLNNQLHGISLVDHLEFYGVEYGGTAVYEYRTIILEIKDWTTDDWIISTIHHELNHLLVYWNNFPESEWSSFNKRGFKYGGSGVDAIKKGQSSTERVESAFRDGFVNQYGKSTFVEDVATITEYAISDRADFNNRALNYSIIENKFEVLKKFYRSLNSSFNDDFWTGKKNEKNNIRTQDNKKTQNKQEQKIEDQKSEIQFYSYLDPYVYKDQFTKNETYIAYYFELDNSKTEYESVDVSATYYYPDGSLVGEFTKTYETKGGEDIIKCSWGFGWKDPGKWVKGKYKVEVYVNDEFYVEAYFSVK